MSCSRPSERSCEVRMPRSACVARPATAPPARPRRRRRRTARRCARSVQSSRREKVSGADHQRALELPAAQEAVGDRQRVDEARAHRLQVEGGARGRCRARLHRRPRSPERCCPASRSRARSDRSTARRRRRRASAARAAASARSEVISPGAAMWRSRMPVRCAIHSSEVSTVPASSALVSTRCGR